VALLPRSTSASLLSAVSNKPSCTTTATPSTTLATKLHRGMAERPLPEAGINLSSRALSQLLGVVLFLESTFVSKPSRCRRACSLSNSAGSAFWVVCSMAARRAIMAVRRAWACALVTGSALTSGRPARAFSHCWSSFSVMVVLMPVAIECSAR